MYFIGQQLEIKVNLNSISTITDVFTYFPFWPINLKTNRDSLKLKLALSELFYKIFRKKYRKVFRNIKKQY